ncbi:tetratricopeptide repeat protein [Massilia sp. W12]|uniref:CHAT domain-containing tetratricopeptide repeat protein n=1 Tax=Massilia sp. W12 TaxID=3126507 RepID=UPI0030D1FEFE
MPIERILSISKQYNIAQQDFLHVQLLDAGQGEFIEEYDDIVLPRADDALCPGYSVGQFLQGFHRGEPLLEEARHYGCLLYQALFSHSPKLAPQWQAACTQAAARDANGQPLGLRLEIRIAQDSPALSWDGAPLSMLPFELLHDGKGFLFLRPRWSSFRTQRNQATRAPHARAARQASLPRVMLAYANTCNLNGARLPQQDFIVHEQALQVLQKEGRADCLPPLRHASRENLDQSLRDNAPQVLIWIGHGASQGSALLLHNQTHPAYPQDTGESISAQDFACLANQAKLDLAMLWSCHGAGTSQELSQGVAEALLDPDYGDVMAVLAAHSALDAKLSAQFSSHLLQNLAQRADGDLEQALAASRAAMSSDTLFWARPVLHSRAKRQQPVYQLPKLSAAPPAAPALLRDLPSLPPLSPHFSGRDDALAHAIDSLQTHAVLVLEGMAGVGKTALALALAAHWRAQGKSVAFVAMHALADLSQLKYAMAQWRGLQEVSSDAELFAAYHNLDWLLLVDNAEDILQDAPMQNSMLAFLQGMRAASPHFRCLLTSRRALPQAQPWIAAREVPPLASGDACALFIASAGPRLAPADHAKLPQLMENIACNARAIVLLAGQLGAQIGVAQLLLRLAQAGPSAISTEELFQDPVPENWSVAKKKRFAQESLLLSMQLTLDAAGRENPHALLLFDVLGAFPAGLAQELLPHADFPWLADALSILLQYHLLSLHGETRRLQQAAPLAVFAALRLQKREDQEQAWPLLWALYQRLAARTVACGNKFGTEEMPQALRWMQMEEGNLLQALAQLAARGDEASADLALGLLQDLGKSFDFGDRAQAGVEKLGKLLQSVFKVWPRHAASPVGHRVLGNLKLFVDDLPGARADCQSALVLYEAIDEKLGQANALLALGEVKRRMDDLPGARADCQSALALYEAIDEKLGQANALRALGELKLRVDDLPGAGEDYQSALALYEAIDDKLGQANTLKALGDLKQRVDDLPGARADYQSALALYEAIDEKLGQANTLRALGNLKLRLGDLPGARADCQSALALYEAIDDKLGQANALLALGEVKRRMDDLPGARADYQSALALYEAIDEKLGQANILQVLGLCDVEQDKLATAFRHLIQAWQMHESIQNQLGMAACFGYLARIAAQAGRLMQACALNGQALHILTAIDDRYGQKIALSDLGQSLLSQDQQLGLAALYRAWQVAQAIQDPGAENLGRKFTVQLKQALPADEYATQMTALATDLQTALDDFLADLAAKVAAGEIDLFAPPPDTEGDA